jgi:hypothetical protein
MKLASIRYKVVFIDKVVGAVASKCRLISLAAGEALFGQAERMSLLDAPHQSEAGHTPEPFLERNRTQ